MSARMETCWYVFRVCGSPANPAPSFNGQGMAARCTKCANHDQSPLVVGGRRAESPPAPELQLEQRLTNARAT